MGEHEEEQQEQAPAPGGTVGTTPIADEPTRQAPEGVGDPKDEESADEPDDAQSDDDSESEAGPE